MYLGVQPTRELRLLVHRWVIWECMLVGVQTIRQLLFCCIDGCFGVEGHALWGADHLRIYAVCGKMGVLGCKLMQVGPNYPSTNPFWCIDGCFGLETQALWGAKNLSTQLSGAHMGHLGSKLMPFGVQTMRQLTVLVHTWVLWDGN